MKEPDTSIWVETLVSHRTGEPLVEIRWYDHSGQLSPDEARVLAVQIMEAADAATSDAFLVHFMKKVGLPNDGQAALLNEFRAYRRRMENV